MSQLESVIVDRRVRVYIELYIKESEFKCFTGRTYTQLTELANVWDCIVLKSADGLWDIDLYYFSIHS